MAMDELGEDLLLLAAGSAGRLPIPPNLRFGLAGSELVRLAAAGRVDIVRGRIVIRDTAPTGDALLDEALASMAGRSHGPTVRAWVARDRRGLVKRYLARAEAAGIIRADRHRALGLFPVTRWKVLDAGRAAQARARLQFVAASTEILDPAQAALAGLASAIDVTRRVFPGWAGRTARKRLRQAGRRDPATAGPTSAVADAVSTPEAHRTGTNTPTEAAQEAAGHASLDEVVRAAIRAATNAAVSAAGGA
jgi:hypothetical protein